MQSAVLKTRHLLVLDDDTRIRSLLARYLQESGARISTAKDAREARAILTDFLIDLCIVDVMLPEETGIEFTHNLRQTGNRIPVLMLTAMGETPQRIEGLESGADDYLAKPFEPKELLLRIERILERTHEYTPPKASTPLLHLGALRFDLKKGILSHSEHGPLTLTSKEIELLSVLAAHLNQTMTRESLAQLCGGLNERSIDVLITRLRTKIEPTPKQPLYLRTVWGEGYALFAENENF